MITKADILLRVNAITERSLTDIDDELLEVLLDISGRDSFLTSSVSGTFITGNTIAIPTDMAILDEIVVNSTRLEKITFAEYLDQTSGYAQKGNLIYIYPTPATGVTYTVYYGKTHSEDVETIEFGTRFRKAIIEGVVAAIYNALDNYDKAREHTVLYENEISKLMGSDFEVSQPAQIRRYV